MRPKAVQEYIDGIARMGGQARAEKLTDKRRKEIAQGAARARWAKQKKAK